LATAHLRRWLKEPLFHFLLIGACLFALFDQIADRESAPENHIVISAADIGRMNALFERKWRRLPTAEELRGLIDATVREEILYREALAMGLDQDDTIVRRRMAQKVEFLFDDLADTAPPAEEELQGFLDDNADRFTKPARMSFSHVYLSTDKRGAGAADDAQRILASFEAQPAALDPTAVGDRFMVGYSFENQSGRQVARLFGAPFAEALAAVEAGSWHGPIASGYGLHLVYVTKRTEPRLPPLAEIREAVLYELLAERRLQANRKFYESMRERYTVTVERPAPDQASGARAQSSP